MAYSFPPRGFTETINNQPIRPNFGRPPFPPPMPFFQGSPAPPMGHPVRNGMSPFNRGTSQFGPPPFGGRFPHPNPRAVRPGPRGLGPPRYFPPRLGDRPHRPMAPQDPQFHRFNPANMPVNDITSYESWPGSAGTAGRQYPHRESTGNNRPNNFKRSGPSNQKKGKNRRFKRKASQQDGKSYGPGNDRSTNSNDTTRPQHCCDVCDRGFKTKDLLDEHLTQHTKCKHPGCRFEAHFKVVKNHAKMQHGPGSKKVMWLNNSEDINRWREERKRNYPSAANIARKVAIMQTNEEKGVVLENKYFGKMRRGKRGRHQHGGPGRDYDMAAKRARVDTAGNSSAVHMENADTNKDPHQSKTVTSHDLPRHQAEVTSGVPQGSLGALVSAYDDSDDEEETDMQQGTNASEESKFQKIPSPRNKTNGEGCSSSGARKWKRGTNGRKKKDKTGYEGRQESSRAKREMEEQKLKRRPNLLEMLLAPEIRRERNIILQCVRYIVQNDFFGVSTPKPDGQTANTDSVGEPSPPCAEKPSADEDGLNNVVETNGSSQDPNVGVNNENNQVATGGLKERPTASRGADAEVGLNIDEKNKEHQETLVGLEDEMATETTDKITCDPDVGVENKMNDLSTEGPEERPSVRTSGENPEVESKMEEKIKKQETVIGLADEIAMATKGNNTFHFDVKVKNENEQVSKEELELCTMERPSECTSGVDPMDKETGNHEILVGLEDEITMATKETITLDHDVRVNEENEQVSKKEPASCTSGEDPEHGSNIMDKEILIGLKDEITMATLVSKEENSNDLGEERSLDREEDKAGKRTQEDSSLTNK